MPNRVARLLCNARRTASIRCTAASIARFATPTRLVLRPSVRSQGIARTHNDQFVLVSCVLAHVAPTQTGADPELHIPRRRAARAFRRERAQILDGNCKSGTTHDSDCATPIGHCTPSGVCVECTDSSQCPAATPTCGADLTCLADGSGSGSGKCIPTLLVQRGGALNGDVIQIRLDDFVEHKLGATWIRKALPSLPT